MSLAPVQHKLRLVRDVSLDSALISLTPVKLKSRLVRDVSLDSALISLTFVFDMSRLVRDVSNLMLFGNLSICDQRMFVTELSVCFSVSDIE